MILNNKIKSEKCLTDFSELVYNLSLASILIGLLFSRAAITIGFVLFILNWFIEGNFSEKLNVLKKNKRFAFISLIFIIYLFGLSYTSETYRALNNLKIKLPLLLPIFFFSLKNLRLTIKVDLLIITFIVAVVLKSVILYVKFLLQVDCTGIEELYKIDFYSNIRLALFIVMSIFCLFYLVFLKKKTDKLLLKLVSFFAIVWLMFFLHFLNSLTGYIIFSTLLLFAFYLYLQKIIKQNYIVLFSIVLLIIISLSISYLVYTFADFQKTDLIDYNTLPDKTINGNSYEHDTLSKLTECGHYVDLYVCRKEMEQEWNKKSKLLFSGKDLKGQSLEATLKRYLSSRNLTKDSAGISELSNEEIKHIENSCANHLYSKTLSIKAKLYLIWWQLHVYDITGDASNQSISQRIEYYKISFMIINRNFWFGVGTAAVLNESFKMFEAAKSKTRKKHWNLVHNQFVYVFVSFGIVGFILFVFLFFQPLSINKMLKNELFTAFYLLIFLSFLSDNTFETQLGISFFVVFYCLTAVGIFAGD